ncbi:MAG TPA: hypothetical protein VKI65_15955, partial [Gemmataceae bacterium]|nr:hypothetical protein [Gemmataceae bacterium]
KDEMLERIRRDQTISEPVRQQALSWMEGYRESPYQLNAASRAVARRTHEKPAAYRLALRQAEAACRLEPNIGPYLTTLGMAQYQLGQYPEALKKLTQSDKMNSAKFEASHPADLAFLAMTHHQLGHKAQAAATLARLREVMKNPEWATNAEAKDFLQEAETLIEGKAGKAKQ